MSYTTTNTLACLLQTNEDNQNICDQQTNTMHIFEIAVPPNWDAEKDIAEFENRFCDDYEDHHEYGLHKVDEACADLKLVLAQALRYFLDRTTNPLRVPVNALTVTETCHFILELVVQSGREPEYVGRFEKHLAAVLHYEGQRAMVLKRLWANPEHVWLIELADLADTTVTARWELDEAMACEHDDYTSTV